MTDIDVATLRLLLRYDPETGDLYWLPRDSSWFGPTRFKTAQQVCNWWNGRFAGTRALAAKGFHGCLAGNLLGKSCYAHRAAWALHAGVWPSEEIDHINGDRADNRIVNLRAVSHAVNMTNKKLYASNKSGAHGVAWHPTKRRWAAYITISGKRKQIGMFASCDEAIAARRARERVTNAFHANHGRAA